MCSKWQELGLLYASEELDNLNRAEFESHLNECKECVTELDSYLSDKKNLFTPELLGEIPSDAISSEIKRVCASSKKQYTTTPLFSLVAKKAAVSMLLLVIGFATITYVRLNSDQALSIRARMAVNDHTTDSVTAALSQQDSAMFDSLKRNPDVNFSKTRGNMNLQGVVPVDLQE